MSRVSLCLQAGLGRGAEKGLSVLVGWAVAGGAKKGLSVPAVT